MHKLKAESVCALDDEEYIKQFFVGLLEGDGTITSNLNTGSTSIRVRIAIALKNLPENVNMLIKISEVVGGRVVIERNDEYVTWLATSAADLAKVYKILEKYPLLTSRKISQLKFVQTQIKDIDKYLENRDAKYDNKEAILEELSKKECPYYFPAWLSGFIEAEGNFSLVYNEKGHMRKSAFAIGQNDEMHILIWIRDYFNGQTKILQDKPKKDSKFKYYRLYLYNAETRRCLFDHFNKYPLLGYKLVSYLKFRDYHQSKRK